MTKPNPQGRLFNTTSCLPFAYGSIAFYLGSKSSDEYHTHKWTLYVRSPDPTTYDISVAISKVIFQLHPSFTQPTREVCEPPYEVTETGWGEFEASIRIVWKEESEERSTILTHGIKLYPKNVPANLLSMDPAAYMTTTVPVVSEKYDEVVFTNPKASFHQSLLNGHLKKGDKKCPYPLSNEPCVMEHFRTYGDETEVKAMLAAKKFLEDELRNVKDRLLRVDAELEEVKHALAVTKAVEGGGGSLVTKSLLVPASSSSTVAAPIITPSSSSSSGIIGNNKSGIITNSGSRAAGSKTMKKKAALLPQRTTSASLSAVVESQQQPPGKKLKTSN